MKIFKKINWWFTYLISKRVGQAMNDGATYEEICAIVEEEMAR